MDTVYLCIGEDVDYERQSRWIARVFASEAAAVAWAERANAIAKDWIERRQATRRREAASGSIRGVAPDETLEWLIESVGDPAYKGNTTAWEPSYEVEAHPVEA